MSEDEKQIVEWLRERADDLYPFRLYQGDPIGAALSAAATAIERGEHRKANHD